MEAEPGELIFDNPATDDDLKLADWQVIDLAGAAEHEDLCEAALFYLLERLAARFGRSG